MFPEEKCSNLSLENTEENFQFVDDPSLFEFNEVMKDQKDPDDIEACPVPCDFPMELSAEDELSIAYDTDAGFCDNNTLTDYTSELLEC